MLILVLKIWMELPHRYSAYKQSNGLHRESVSLSCDCAALDLDTVHS